MNPQQPPGPGFWPFPFFGSYGVMSPPSLARPNEVPARVEVAMELLRMLTAKTGDLPAAGFSCLNVEVVPGQTLSPEEEYARDHACQMLGEYFQGKMPPDLMEQAWLERMKPPEALQPGGMVIRCLACQDGVASNKRHCKMCRGAGSLVVYPTSQNPDLEELA